MRITGTCAVGYFSCVQTFWKRNMTGLVRFKCLPTKTCFEGLIKVKQSRYWPGEAQRVPGS
jgi:hypothetical protein